MEMEMERGDFSIDGKTMNFLTVRDAAAGGDAVVFARRASDHRVHGRLHLVGGRPQALQISSKQGRADDAREYLPDRRCAAVVV